MAKYIKQEMPNLNGTKEPQVYYRLKTSRNIDFKELVEQICQPGTGVSRGTVEQVMAHVADKLATLIGKGYSVSINGIGTFKGSISLKQDKDMDSFKENEAKLNARSLQLTNVNFRADKQLVKEANRQCKLVRGGTSRLQKSPYSKEERLQKALEYLEGHGAMRVTDYAKLTKLSRSVATKELMEFRQNPASGISFIGRGSNIVYVKRVPEE